MKQFASRLFSHLLSAAVAALILASSASIQAHAGTFKLFGSPIEMAYAPQPAPLDQRFEQFENNEEEMHEMNDAWLGMPVHGADGKLAGFVVDAYLDMDGEISELLVSLPDHGYAVYVDGIDVELQETKVSVALSSIAIANLEREEAFLVSSR